jgi:hypothetical protein
VEGWGKELLTRARHDFHLLAVQNSEGHYGGCGGELRAVQQKGEMVNGKGKVLELGTVERWRSGLGTGGMLVYVDESTTSSREEKDWGSEFKANPKLR